MEKYALKILKLGMQHLYLMSGFMKLDLRLG